MPQNFLLSEQDAKRLEHMLRWFDGRGEPDRMRRRRPGTGGSTKRYARITQSLRRPDPTADPPIIAISNYKIKLLSEAICDDWSAIHGIYMAGDKVEYNDLDYKCTIMHIASEMKNPDNTSFWMCVSIDAWVLGYYYSDDLLPTCPWYQVGDIIEVVSKAQYDEDGAAVPDSARWWIHGTINKVEEQDENELSCSMSWNADENRSMAVYK